MWHAARYFIAGVMPIRRARSIICCIFYSKMVIVLFCIWHCERVIVMKIVPSASAEV